MTDQTQATFCLKHNNTAANRPCAICGERTDPVIGLEVFVEGTWADLCHECIDKYASELAPYRGMGSDPYNPIEGEFTHRIRSSKENSPY